MSYTLPSKTNKSFLRVKVDDSTSDCPNQQEDTAESAEPPQPPENLLHTSQGRRHFGKIRSLRSEFCLDAVYFSDRMRGLSNKRKAAYRNQLLNPSKLPRLDLPYDIRFPLTHWPTGELLPLPSGLKIRRYFFQTQRSHGRRRSSLRLVFLTIHCQPTTNSPRRCQPQASNS